MKVSVIPAALAAVLLAFSRTLSGSNHRATAVPLAILSVTRANSSATSGRSRKAKTELTASRAQTTSASR